MIQYNITNVDVTSQSYLRRIYKIYMCLRLPYVQDNFKINTFKFIAQIIVIWTYDVRKKDLQVVLKL